MTLPELNLPSVSLPEVVGGWSLQERVDRKYLLPLAAVIDLLHRPAASYAVLEIDGRRCFGYRTVYFDTPDLNTYRDHAQGVRRRFKVRIRRYTDSDLTRLEVKSKGVRSRTVKYALDGTDRLDEPAREFVRQCLDTSYGPAFQPDIVGLLDGGLTMSYRRTTLVSGAGERVTIDTDLKMRNDHVRTLLLPGFALMEVKTTQTSSQTDRALLRAGHRPVSFSKYVAGVELTTGQARRHHPRLLREHFRMAA